MSPLVTTWLTVLLVLVAVAMVLAFARVVLGPDLPNRVAAFDLATTAALGLLTLYAMLLDQPMFLDVGIVVALIAFVGTIAFANRLEEDLRP